MKYLSIFILVLCLLSCNKEDRELELLFAEIKGTWQDAGINSQSSGDVYEFEYCMIIEDTLILSDVNNTVDFSLWYDNYLTGGLYGKIGDSQAYEVKRTDRTIEFILSENISYVLIRLD